ILLANAGPHVVPPKSSPPPRGIRLDSYEGIMAKEGLVVPGKPDRSARGGSAGLQRPAPVGEDVDALLPPLPFPLDAAPEDAHPGEAVVRGELAAGRHLLAPDVLHEIRRASWRGR